LAGSLATLLTRSIRPFGQLADLNGRTSRLDFWPYILLLIAVAFWTLVMMDRAPLSPPWAVLLPRLLFALLLNLLGWAATVRRLHDVGWSGRWVHVSVLMTVLIASSVIYSAYQMANGACPLCFGIFWPPWLELMVPVQLLLWAIIGCVCLVEGTRGPNRYGSDPQ
jgi:uncharacterized membrane protein YhaH (DUF805 family)